MLSVGCKKDRGHHIRLAILPVDLEHAHANEQAVCIRLRAGSDVGDKGLTSFALLERKPKFT